MVGESRKVSDRAFPCDYSQGNADGSVDYETSFTDIEDFNESYYCILKCIGKEVGIATDNPKVLTYACVIRGKEEIEKELLHGNGKQLEYI